MVVSIGSPFVNVGLSDALSASSFSHSNEEPLSGAVESSSPTKVAANTKETDLYITTTCSTVQLNFVSLICACVQSS